MRVVALAVALTLGAAAAAADETPATPCDALAAHPWDPDRAAEGVAYEALDEAALDACRAAVAVHPSSPRLAYQLGRVLERLGYLGAALGHLRQAAEAGHAQAQYALGVLHYDVRGAVRDDDEAVRWLRRAAARDHGPALAALAMAHRDGRGARFDPGLAFITMRRAAHEGFVQAQYAVGMACVTGMIDGFDADPATRAPCTEGEATMWLATAANKGHADARRALEEMGLLTGAE